MVNIKYDINNGPNTKPRIPKMDTPIITPTTVMIGWVPEIPFAIIKRSTLSILVIMTKPKSIIPNPEVSFPFANSIIAAGINTSGADEAGLTWKRFYLIILLLFDLIQIDSFHFIVECLTVDVQNFRCFGLIKIHLF